MPYISRRTVLVSAAAMPLAGAWAAPAPGSYGMIRRRSAELDTIIAQDAVVEQIGWGYKWTEGPVWVKNGGYLLFSDPQANIMYRWDPATGVSTFLQPSGYAGAPDPALREPGSNGLAIDGSGTLVLCDSGSRGIARVDLATKKRTVLADHFEGKRFNSPNDLVITKSGAIYFTDPPYGLANIERSAVKELPYSGVFRLAPDGTVALVDKTLALPNGIALSPDESTLYVTNSDKAEPVLKTYQLGPDGLPQVSQVMFDMKPLQTPEAPSNPDGLKVDEDGNIFVSGPGGILILSKEGDLLGRISITGRVTSNCAFGEDGSTLFITAADIVTRVRLKTRAANWG